MCREIKENLLCLLFFPAYIVLFSKEFSERNGSL